MKAWGATFLWTLLVLTFSRAVLCPGVTQGDGPVSAKAVRDSTNPAAVHQLREPGLVPLAHLETDEATHASRTHFYSMESCVCLV